MGLRTGDETLVGGGGGGGSDDGDANSSKSSEAKRSLGIVVEVVVVVLGGCMKERAWMFGEAAAGCRVCGAAGFGLILSKKLPPLSGAEVVS